MFYYNSQPGYGKGEELTFTFLTPLNRLFEYFIYKLLKDCCNDLDKYKALYQKPQKYLGRSSNNNSRVFLQRPDITIVNNNIIESIIDVKYKNPLDGPSISVNQADIYQMISYSINYGCKIIYLLYPTFRENKVRTSSLLESYIIDRENTKININIVQINITEDVKKIKKDLCLVINGNKIDAM